jgi:hypothetical protein
MIFNDLYKKERIETYGSSMPFNELVNKIDW